MNELYPEDGDAFQAPRVKMLLYGLVYAGLAIGFAALALTPGGHDWLADQVPLVEQLLAAPPGRTLIREMEFWGTNPY